MLSHLYSTTTMECSEAADSLRKFFAKTALKTLAPTSSQSSDIATSSSAATLASASATGMPIRPRAPSLRFPTVNVPGSLPKSATANMPSRAPQSIFGGNVALARNLSTQQAPEPPYSTTRKTPHVLSGLSSIFHSGSPSKNAGGSALMRANTRESMFAKDSISEHPNSLNGIPSNTASQSTNTPSPRSLGVHCRTARWIDQTANTVPNVPSQSLEVDVGSQQAPQSSKDSPLLVSQTEDDSKSTASGSTLSFSSSIDSALNLAPKVKVPTTTTEKKDEMPAIASSQ